MSAIAPRNPQGRIPRWTRRALLACGVLMLGYCGFVLLDTGIFQKQERLRFDLRIARHEAPPMAAGGVIGRMEIPRLGISAMVIDGISGSILRRAVGHIPGTALPGQPGNIAISGHRDTFFRPLRNIRQDDIITITTLSGEYRYRVVSTKVVAPSDVAVLDAGADEILTLVTCYPFYFVGPAPDRFIVRAKRIGRDS